MIEMDECTGYQWCVDSNMRVLDLSPEEEESYYTLPVTKKTFTLWLASKTIKPNSSPRKTLPYLEYRLYGVVPYNISSIQSGIQYGHAVQEYNNLMLGMILNPIKNEQHRDMISSFDKWRTEDKTFIILNGGTTNENKSGKFYGSMQKFRDTLIEDTNIAFATFNEPDLNDALSGIVFLVDERVFNTELYPNYVDMPFPWTSKGRGYRPNPAEMSKWEGENEKNRYKWIEKIGGVDNDFLRTNLRNFRLAN